MQEALDQFHQHLKYERNMSPHTLRNYESDLAQFREFIFKVEKRDLGPAEIDRLTIREWMAALDAAGTKKATRARKLASDRGHGSAAALQMFQHIRLGDAQRR